MSTIQQIFSSYTHILDFLPEETRVLVALGIIAVLLILFLRFVQKSIAWMLLFVLLLPASLPALREIGTYLWERVLAPLIK